jgi:hypothetical protein
MTKAQCREPAGQSAPLPARPRRHGKQASGPSAARIFVVSRWGSPITNWKALRPAQRKQSGGLGPCAFIDPRGRLVPKELARLETIIHGYEAQLAAGCKRTPDAHTTGERLRWVAPGVTFRSIYRRSRAAGGLRSRSVSRWL